MEVSLDPEIEFFILKTPLQGDDFVYWDEREVYFPYSTEESQKVEIVFCGYTKKREKELERLRKERPSKEIDRQGYYTYKAREEQLKYEITIRRSEKDFARGNLFDGWEHYWDAKNHLDRRTQYEFKAAMARQETFRAGRNPPPLDINFINNGIQMNISVTF